ncbi:hypothetical protein I302_106368 [Kwoniella bestiolae CBS 10118]|uniref:Uncharacterized protein n=1 Tax=Kwoniella bestiolae CBS 10118 TaxID=1296100 RepID=A0A1B9G3N3_9TREE|nr:hypothetical protein I302_05491 [Kwoniella bestiolae CBS 10118]OCF25667.1 hypothetical protein I302_05491 [Kwoniella bestiolae CBS 10118]
MTAIKDWETTHPDEGRGCRSPGDSSYSMRISTGMGSDYGQSGECPTILYDPISGKRYLDCEGTHTSSALEQAIDKKWDVDTEGYNYFSGDARYAVTITADGSALYNPNFVCALQEKAGGWSQL